MYSNSNKLRVFCAFAGYDSQLMALDRLGIPYECQGWSEIDKYAICAHNAVYPQWADRNYGDISKIDWSTVPDFDLFTYSSPCQDFSQAGKQAGGVEGSGTRSSLLWECRRAIVAKKPKYLLMENVAALVGGKFIRLFNKWQLELESYGYRNYAAVLNAKDYGVPQNRERIFMVSILDENARYEFPRPIRLKECLRDRLEQGVPDRYYLSRERIEGILKSTAKESDRGNGFAFKPTDGSGVANTIQTSSTRKTDNYILESVHILGNLQPDNLWGVSIRQQNQIVGTDGLSPAITAQHARHEFKIAEQIVLGWTRDAEGNIIDRHPVEVANAVTAGKRDNTQNYVVEIDGQFFRIRKLTERECFRLMGVSESDIDKIQNGSGFNVWDGHKYVYVPRISRTQQTHLAGNSIVVDVMVHIFDKLFLHTEITEPTLF